ncbi:MAG: hypothetical protein LBF49_02885 [Puniceicoccales bacterium]|nr:hypothetical protein [Puniceicoccales bacterium]
METGAGANKIGEGGAGFADHEDDQIAHGGHGLGRCSAAHGRLRATEEDLSWLSWKSRGKHPS